MIGFERPLLLFLLLPWAAVWGWFARHQRRSAEWVWSRVAERFRLRFTLYRRRTLRRQMLLLLALGALLVVAAAGPGVRGETPVRELAGRVVLLVDGSASMLADDAAGGTGQLKRFDHARQIARELSQRLERTPFAIVTFSGAATLQLPMTADRAAVEEAITALSFHTFYQSTGSSFATALDALLHFVEPGRGDLQAVLLSDGEQPFPEPFEEPLSVLAERRVPVHAVAIGTREGQSRVIFDFNDIVAQAEEPRALVEFETRREDRHLKRIARRTGGRFLVADATTAEALMEAVTDQLASAESVREEGRIDLGWLPLGLFLAGFLFESLLWGRRRGSEPPAFELARLAAARPPARAALGLFGLTLVALTLSVAACQPDTPVARAARENERGIAADALQQWGPARVHYQRSRGYQIRPEIPSFNLARSVTLQGDFSEAHELYQAALELAPELAPAHYNDGHALYRWGAAEIDPAGCQLARTLELWSAARLRFASAAELYPEASVGRDRSRRNLRGLGERIAEVEALIADPPPQCLAEGQAESGAGAEEDQQAGDAGGGEEGQPRGESGEPQEGGDDEQRQTEGGESEQEQDPEAGGDGDGGEEDQAEGETGEGEERPEGENGEGEEQPEGEKGEGEEQPEGERGEGEEGLEGDQSEEDEQPPGGGGGESNESDAEPSGGGEAPLTGEELDRIRQAFERMTTERSEDGKFHFRTLPEQFPPAVWQNPDREIWW